LLAQFLPQHDRSAVHRHRRPAGIPPTQRGPHVVRRHSSRQRGPRHDVGVDRAADHGAGSATVNFISLEFSIFLVCCSALYWLVPAGVARLWLLTVASYVFYAAWDWRFCALMLFVTANAYVAGRHLEAGERSRKLVLAVSIAIDLGVLAVFKYLDFFAANVGQLASALGLDLAVPAMNILLPVGISFYTFHAMSYVIDVYRGAIDAERSPLKVALYIAFFPQLIAGPIVRAWFFMPQLMRPPRFRSSQQITGMKLFVLGFIYKAAIADSLGQICDPIYANVGEHADKALLIAAVAFYA